MEMASLDQAQIEMVINGNVPDSIEDHITGMHGMGGVGIHRYQPGLLRPYIDRRGVKKVSIAVDTRNKTDEKGNIVLNKKGMPIREDVCKEVPIHDLIMNGINSPVYNATLALRKDEWQMLDARIVKAYRARLRLVRDIANVNLRRVNGMSTTILEHETISESGEAFQDMDSLTTGRTDQPLLQLEGTPLPYTHSNFWMSSRQLGITRTQGEDLRMRNAEQASRRVAEKLENVTIGIQTGLTYGVTADYSRAPTAYGLTNFGPRNTKTNMTAPTGSNGTTIKTDWLALRALLHADNRFGPYVAYVSTNYDQHLDNLFSTTEPSAGTLRENLLKIDGITDIRRLDYLTTASVVILVQMDSETVELVEGLPLSTTQWDEKGGAQLNFRVQTIQVVRFYADYSGNCGIAHGTTA